VLTLSRLIRPGPLAQKVVFATRSIDGLPEVTLRPANVLLLDRAAGVGGCGASVLTDHRGLVGVEIPNARGVQSRGA
jgi:hypothetical protein